ncbi:MAG: cytochrome c [Acidobacteriota bacterium]
MNKKTIVTFAALLALTVDIFFPHQSQAVNPVVSEGASLFKAKCAACHAADGSGTEMGKKMGAHDLGAAEVQKQSDAQINTIIANGKAKMPGFAKSLDAGQIQQLVAHIRTLKK